MQICLGLVLKLRTRTTLRAREGKACQARAAELCPVPGRRRVAAPTCRKCCGCCWACEGCRGDCREAGKLGWGTACPISRTGGEALLLVVCMSAFGNTAWLCGYLFGHMWEEENRLLRKKC